MSTGADCRFWYVEKRNYEGDGACECGTTHGAVCLCVPKEGWHYKVQRYPYGQTDEYDTYGPFVLYTQAYTHMDDNPHFGNPGSYIIESRPKFCAHQVTHKAPSYRKNEATDKYEWTRDLEHCDQCGRTLEEVAGR